MVIKSTRCNARTKSSGKPCQRWVVPGMTKCRVHGGASPVGADSPHFKHGRYSKHLPSQLLDKYREAQKDRDLLNLKEEIYLIDIRLKSLIEELPDNGVSHSWTDLKKLWREFITVYNDGDILGMKSIVPQLSNMIETGAGETIVWEGIQKTIDKRRRLVESESKRLVDMQQTITADRAMALIYAMLDIVRTNLVIYRDKKVPVDDRLLQGISSGIRSLIMIPEKVTPAEEEVNE